MPQGELNLTPNEFWTEPFRTRRDLQFGLMDRTEEGLLFDAPPVVDLAARDTAPVVVVRVATGVNLARAPVRGAGVITAVDLGNNLTYAAAAVSISGRNAPPPVPRGEPPTAGLRGEGHVIDLRDRLGLPWKPTEYLVRLILHDRVFGPLRVRFGAAPGAYHDPEVEKYLTELRRRPDVPPLAPDPRERVQPYAPDPNPPPVPAEKGIELRVRRVVEMDDPKSVVLRCSFRLPVLRRHVVPPGADPWNPATAALFDQLGETDAPPRGVVRIGLVMTGSVRPAPFVAQLAVPTRDPVPPGDGPHLVTGSFRVDLQTLGNVKGVEQTLFLYAFADDVLAGPVPIGISAEPLIR